MPFDRYRNNIYQNTMKIYTITANSRRELSRLILLKWKDGFSRVGRVHKIGGWFLVQGMVKK